VFLLFAVVDASGGSSVGLPLAGPPGFSPDGNTQQNKEHANPKLMENWENSPNLKPNT